ncbi:MAG: hypothetical protein NTX03_12800 [Bacteroidetes bacterium]|nr:hypothetical protein [Bacteroidota bacterium]
MKAKIKVIFFLCFCFLLLNSSHGFGQDIKVVVPNKKYLVGDTINVKIQATAEAGSKIKIDSPILKLSKLELINIIHGSTNPQGYAETICIISGFDSGVFWFPPVRVSVFSSKDSEHPTSVKFSDSVPIYISTMDVDLKKEIKPIKDILEPEKSWLDYLPYIAGLVALLLIALVFYFVLKRKRKIPVVEAAVIPQQPLLSAKEEAMQAIQKLMAENFLEKGENKIYYTALTDILRRYISRKFNIETLEKTTAEILSSLKEKERVSELTQSLKNTLEVADLVKFARLIPNETTHENTTHATVDFIEKTSESEE